MWIGEIAIAVEVMPAGPIQPDNPRSPTGRQGGDDGQGQAAGHLGAVTPSWRSAALHLPTASCDDHSIDHGQKHDPGHLAPPVTYNLSPNPQ